MGKLSDYLALARTRAEQLKVPYAGALTPREAHDLLQLAPGAKLVDVRTHAEQHYVGRVPGAVEIEWQSYPTNQANPNFLTQLGQQVDREALVMFLCRSGARSHAAAKAATAAGFTNCYNVLEGFEGDKDANHHRNTVGGWRASGLPWTQS
ncbi:MAG: rhodanese-like domain-containing protein [Rhodocyclaceae bacterium]|nr:rhodanese-like domain-containing protein [Rhodocyclaceae bacterium]MBX3667901.1 rhodanese-like domain-containing protein [Rhodocyclaceae bacterium]